MEYAVYESSSDLLGPRRANRQKSSGTRHNGRYRLNLEFERVTRRLHRPRRQRHAEILLRARVGLSRLPDLGRFPDEVATSRIPELTALVAAVAEARRCARRRSLTRVLLQEAQLWLCVWLTEWHARHLPTPQILLLYAQMKRHLSRTAARLAVVAEMELQNRGYPRWPSKEQWHGRCCADAVLFAGRVLESPRSTSADHPTTVEVDTCCGISATRLCFVGHVPAFQARIQVSPASSSRGS